MRSYLVFKILGLTLLSVSTPGGLRAQDERGGEEVGRQGVFFALLSSRYSVERGEPVEVRLAMAADTPVDLAAFSVEFDEHRLELVEAAVDPALPEGAASAFEWHHESGEDWVQVAVELDPSAQVFDGELHSLAVLRFQVPEDARPGNAQVRFTRPGSAGYDGHFQDGKVFIYNAFRRRGRPDSEAPEMTVPEVTISILGDVGLFNRGDANTDGRLDISDAVYLLDFFYQGGPPPLTEKCGDANGDGAIDLSDVLTLLGTLFTG